MKMVLFRTSAGVWNKKIGMLIGGPVQYVGRFTIGEDGKIKAEVLDSAPLPKGYEYAAIQSIKNSMKALLKPENQEGARGIPTTMLDVMINPDLNPEGWLEWLHQVYSSCSDYKEFDEKKYAPMKDKKQNNFLTALQSKPSKK